MQNTAEINSLYAQIGKRIAALRKRRKMTQEQLAKILQVSVKHCSSVERGHSCFSLEKLIILSDIFDVSLDYLIGNSENTGERSVPQFVIDMFCRATPDKREKLVELRKVVDPMN